MRILVVIMAIAISMVACNKDDDEPDPNEKDGQITFYTKSSDCGAIEIQLNGVVVGPLSSVY